MSTVDVLAIAAHRDDIELTCGGTLIRAVDNGHRVALVDLTQGEMGSRGSAALRAQEAAKAAEIIGAVARENVELPDAHITNDPVTRERVVRMIRKFKPRVVIAPAQLGRHPDHRVTAELVRDACFLAGLAKLAPNTPPHRPTKLLHCVTFREDFVKPTFVVDISAQFDRKMAAIKCYSSQFDEAVQAGEVFPNGEPLYDVVQHRSAYYGSLIRCRYGEPFMTAETMRVDDIVALEVSTF